MAVRNEEYVNVRLVTGEVNPETGVNLPITGCIPLQVAKSGQFTTDGINVLGDGSSEFETEFTVDDYLYSASLNEIRRITEVNEKNIAIEYAFSADIAIAEDVYIAPRSIYRSVMVKNIGASVALMQEVSLPAAEVDIRDFDYGCAPFSYDAQASTLMFHLSI